MENSCTSESSLLLRMGTAKLKEDQQISDEAINLEGSFKAGAKERSPNIQSRARDSNRQNFYLLYLQKSKYFVLNLFRKTTNKGRSPGTRTASERPATAHVTHRHTADRPSARDRALLANSN